MPRLIPEDPAFDADKGAEETVWKALVKTLPDEATLLHGVRITNLDGDREGDLIVLWPGKGIAFIEVKGGEITPLADGTFNQRSRDGRVKIIDPVKQSRDTLYLITKEIKRRTSFQHWFTSSSMVAFPYLSLPATYHHDETERHDFISKSELDHAADWVAKSIEGRMRGHGIALDHSDIERIVEKLSANIFDPTHPGALAPYLETRDEIVESRVRENERLLEFAAEINRFEVSGPAGSGKTALAIAQAHKLTAEGKRVLFLCYSSALARVLKHDNEKLPKDEKIAAINTLHSIATAWGVSIPEDATDDFWHDECPREIIERAKTRGDDQKFDAIIVDESQDFADSWWEATKALLRDPENGGIFAYGDTGQGVFGRDGTRAMNFVPLVLNTNLRNAMPISDAANLLTHRPAKSLGLNGPKIIYCEVPEDGSIISSADTVADMMLESYRHEHIAMLMTKSRHPVHKELADQSRDIYFKTLWRTDEIFYGTVTGFKGLERNCIILAVDGFHDAEKAREIMYVGSTRARDILVVVSKRETLASCVSPEFMAILDANHMELDDYGTETEFKSTIESEDEVSNV